MKRNEILSAAEIAESNHQFYLRSAISLLEGSLQYPYIYTPDEYMNNEMDPNNPDDVATYQWYLKSAEGFDLETKEGYEDYLEYHRALFRQSLEPYMEEARHMCTKIQ